jgi:hypothetical protein
MVAQAAVIFHVVRRFTAEAVAVAAGVPVAAAVPPAMPFLAVLPVPCYNQSATHRQLLRVAVAAV